VAPTTVLTSLNMADTNDAKAREILHIIEKYGLNYERTGQWIGFETFLPVVKGQVERGESIKMLLPGFPFKSPNTKTKVLGPLPDLGEELALKRLDSIAAAIDEVYEHGAEMHITSDGLVYNSMSIIISAQTFPSNMFIQTFSA
jgi:pyoverdine/dityrosine biosynthesis protein Dit1